MHKTGLPDPASLAADSGSPSFAPDSDKAAEHHIVLVRQLEAVHNWLAVQCLRSPAAAHRLLVAVHTDLVPAAHIAPGEARPATAVGAAGHLDIARRTDWQRPVLAVVPTDHYLAVVLSIVLVAPDPAIAPVGRFDTEEEQTDMVLAAVGFAAQLRSSTLAPPARATHKNYNRKRRKEESS